MHLKKTVTLNISWGIQMKWKNKSSCSDLGYSNQRIKRHQSLTMNKWVHFQCRLLVGPQSSGSTIRSCDSFRESELSYFSSIWWSKRWKIYYFSELILPNISYKVRTCDTAITFSYWLYLPNLAYTSVTAWFMAKSMSPRPKQKCGRTSSTFFNVLLNFSKDCKKQKQHKMFKPDLFKKT